MFSWGVFIDLQKAFDTVDHYILPQKLKYYGVSGIINYIASTLTWSEKLSQRR